MKPRQRSTRRARSGSAARPRAPRRRDRARSRRRSSSRSSCSSSAALLHRERRGASPPRTTASPASSSSRSSVCGSVARGSWNASSTSWKAPPSRIEVVRVPPISTQAAVEELERAVLVRREREADVRRPPVGSIAFAFVVSTTVAPAGGPPPARRRAASASAGRDEAVALAALVEERLRLQVEARERAAGLLARLLRRGQEEPRCARASARRRTGAAPPRARAGRAQPRRAGARAKSSRSKSAYWERGERREPALDEVADEDRVPLEPLRLVHGEERDRVGRRRRRRAATRRVELAAPERGGEVGRRRRRTRSPRRRARSRPRAPRSARASRPGRLRASRKCSSRSQRA